MYITNKQSQQNSKSKLPIEPSKANKLDKQTKANDAEH
jgi:hypothetical protein